MIPILLAASLAAPRIVTLGEAVETARRNQPQIRQARAQTESAGARARAQFGALLPQLNGTANLGTTTHNFGFGASSLDTAGSTFSDSLSLSMLLFDFGTTPFKWKAAQAVADSQGLLEKATSLLVDFNVRFAYFDARADRALVKVAEDTLKNQQLHLRQTQGFVAAGTHPEIDLLQARTDTANALVALITAQNTYETSKVTLNAAMGVLGPTDYDVSDDAMPAVQGEDQQIDALMEEAVRTRPEIQSLEQLVRSNQLTVRSLEGGFWPSISAQAGFRQDGPNPGRAWWNASAGLGLSWNLFSGGATRAQVAAAEADVASEVAQLDLLKQQLRSDVDAARLAVHAAKATIDATREALDNAKARLRLAEQRYAVGVGSAIELGDAQVALTQAAAQAVQADDKLSTARAQLLRALGRR